MLTLTTDQRGQGHVRKPGQPEVTCFRGSVHSTGSQFASPRWSASSDADIKGFVRTVGWQRVNRVVELVSSGFSCGVRLS